MIWVEFVGVDEFNGEPYVDGEGYKFQVVDVEGSWEVVNGVFRFRWADDTYIIELLGCESPHEFDCGGPASHSNWCRVRQCNLCWVSGDEKANWSLPVKVG